MFLLNSNNLQELTSYLQQQNWLQNNEVVTNAAKPGEGNMNYVLRINTATRSFIIKQSRAYVEKYPQVAAPANRATIEGKFYETIKGNETIKNYSPAILGIDAVNNIIALEDLGEANDFTFIYTTHQKINAEDIAAFTKYISHLHNHFYKEVADFELSNKDMRALNHEHIFIYPFLLDNGFNLDNVQVGLQELAIQYKTDNALKTKAKEVGEKYLSNGHYLLHGDFYPGSWLKTNNGVKVIDPEFCFYGHAEFDVAVMIAHLKMTHHSQELIQQIMDNYLQPSGFSVSLLNQFIGIEILRRLLGLAQLPLQLSLNEKKVLLEEAHQLIINF